MSHKITVWITKYALTSGIFAGNAEQDSPSMISLKRPGRMQEYFHGNDWHDSERGAISRAEEMRVKKIASLRKSIAKLEKLKF